MKRKDATRQRNIRAAETCHMRADAARAGGDLDREATMRARAEAFERGAR